MEIHTIYTKKRQDILISCRCNLLPVSRKASLNANASKMQILYSLRLADGLPASLAKHPLTK